MCLQACFYPCETALEVLDVGNLLETLSHMKEQARRHMLPMKIGCFTGSHQDEHDPDELSFFSPSRKAPENTTVVGEQM
jgi:hypothetical protein